MADRSAIEWTDATWSPVRARHRATGKIGWHCVHASPGCANCYAESLNKRLGTGLPFKPGHEKDIEIFLDETMLLAPLRWKKPRMIFVCSMTDLFADFVKDEWIDKLFAVMALAPQHSFQILSKRSKRMREYCSDPQTPFRVTRSLDAVSVDLEIAAIKKEKIVPIDGFPGYFVSNLGRVYTSKGSDVCIRCGAALPENGLASMKFCGKKCRDMESYDRKVGKPHIREVTRRAMAPMPGEDGHSRVMLYRDGKTHRELIHRLVLTAFDRAPMDGEQARHRNGDPTVNALPNLRWGSQAQNWDDSKRHGTHRRVSKLTDTDVREIMRLSASESGEELGRRFDLSATQIRNIISGKQWTVAPRIEWPLSNCWKGVSAEDQQRADERIPDLLATPAAVRWVSYEPALGPVDFTTALSNPDKRLDWIVCGGESGPNARPVPRSVFESARDQCARAGVPFFHKQNGEWIDADEWFAVVSKDGTYGDFDAAGAFVPWRPARPLNYDDAAPLATLRGSRYERHSDGSTSIRAGKRAAGRLLDGVEHNAMPGTR